MSKSERELIVELEAVLIGRRYSPVVIRNLLPIFAHLRAAGILLPGSALCPGSTPREARPDWVVSARWGKPISESYSSSEP